MCEKGHFDTCEVLVQAGANVQNEDLFAQTAYDIASSNGHRKIATFLKVAQKEELFKCDHCEKTFAQSSHLIEHRRREHEKGLIVDEINSENAHIEYFQYSESADENTLFRYFAYSESAGHYIIANKKHVCNYCPVARDFWIESWLLNHISIVHEGIENQCYLCGDMFKLRHSGPEN